MRNCIMFKRQLFKLTNWILVQDIIVKGIKRYIGNTRGKKAGRRWKKGQQIGKRRGGWGRIDAEELEGSKQGNLNDTLWNLPGSGSSNAKRRETGCAIDTTPITCCLFLWMNKTVKFIFFIFLWQRINSCN